MSNDLKPPHDDMTLAEAVAMVDAWGPASDLEFGLHKIARTLRRALDTPEVNDFLDGVKLEAIHQRQRWGEAHDRSKSAENWFWLVGYLSGKALRANIMGDKPTALHHTISAAAALYQWHSAILADVAGGSGEGEDIDLKPGDIGDKDPRDFEHGDYP